MKAVRIHTHGDTKMLKVEDLTEPVISPDKVKIQIRAASLNHLDIWVRRGIPGLSLPLIMGSDGAGVITEVGSSVSGYQVGDEVVIQPNCFCGSCPSCRAGMENYCTDYGIIGETEQGVQCEYTVLDPINVYSKPDHLSFIEAASMPLVFLTAYEMLVPRAGLKGGENILIYGGTSGVGSAAIQIAKDIGAKIAATVGSSHKMDAAYEMGADHVVDHSSPDWIGDLRKFCGRGGFSVIFEHVWKATWDASMKLLGKGGRLVTCGGTTGPFVTIDLRHLFMKQQSILGSTMSSMTSFRTVMKKINEKRYRPFVDQVFPFSKIREAHSWLENRRQIGKVVVVPD